MKQWRTQLFTSVLALFAMIIATTSADAAIVTDGSPGAAAPPATLGPYAMTAFGPDSQPFITEVPGVASPKGGEVAFAPSLMHFEIGLGWTFWSHGYMGDVYWSISSHEATLTLPKGTTAFYFYVQPDPFGVFTFTAAAQDGTMLSQSITSASGGAGVNAEYFGFYATGADSLETIHISGPVDFAIGEFGIAVDETIPADLNGDGVVDGIDLGILLANWSIPPGSPGCRGAVPCAADLNGDAVVDGIDLGILLASWTL